MSLTETLAAGQVLTGSTQVRFQFLAENAVRITHAPLDAPAFPEDRPWLSHVLSSPTPVPTESERVSLGVSLREGLVQITDRAGQVVFSEARAPKLAAPKRLRSLAVNIPAFALEPDFSQVTDAVHLTLSLTPGEGFYGWGEWFNAFRRERGTLKLKIRDAIAMIQHRETYSGLPVFISSRGYAFWLLNSHESHWTIDPEQGVMKIEAAGPGADYIVIYGPAYRELIQTYTRLTGRPPLLPRWALGLMVTGYPQEPQPVVEARVAEHRQRHIPLDAVILDYHWEERYHNFQWRRSLIPDPDRLIAELKSQGVRLGLILTPFVNHKNRAGQRLFLDTLASNRPQETKQDDERDLPGYHEAQSQGYLAHANAKWWFGQGGMIDFSNPAAAAWWNTRMRPLYMQGIAFFKNDDGEYLPRDGRSALGMDGREYHNLYGFFYSRALYNGMAALDNRRPFIYARSVWAGSQRYPAIFLGDQKPTFDHIRSTLRCGLNMGLLGFAHWTADVFGLDGKTTPETHMRYAQWALMAPVARYFWRPPSADNTRFPWSHGQEAEANFRTYAQLRYRLLPYYSALGWEAYQTGLPLIRPLMVEFQADAHLAGVDDQVMLGPALMLAPVVEPGACQRDIYLPAGVWHDFWSTQTYTSRGAISYAAPLDRLPILVRGGTILPMGPALEHIPDSHQFDQLELHIWPPYPAEGVLYDDDGCTRAYQEGAYSVTRFSASQDGASLTVRVGAAQGTFPELPHSRAIEIVIQRATEPRSVSIDGQACTDWRYQADQRCLRVKLNCTVSTGAVVQLKF
jgi:alpha-glucosidase